MRRNLSLGHLRVQQAGSAVIIIRRSVTLLLMLGMVAFLTAGRAASLRGDSRLLGRPEIQGTYGRLPLQFEANQGQTDPDVKFLARGSGYTLFLTPSEAVLALRPQLIGILGRSARIEQSEAQDPSEDRETVVRLKLVGTNPVLHISGLEPLRGRVNYFIGNDPQAWRTNIPTYAKVKLRNVYPGVDVVYYGAERRLEYDFIVAPGVDPDVITLAIAGADNLELDVRGALMLNTGSGHLRLEKPLIYQNVGGIRKEIAGGYALKGTHDVGFRVGAHDRARPLVIDPVVAYSTFLGGSGIDEGFGIAVDVAGNAYVTGFTNAPNFPTANAVQPTFGGVFDAFVAKLDPTGSTLLYSTYLGGSGSDSGLGIAVDAAGNAYVTGSTRSTNFPTVNALQPSFGGVRDAFVAKLNPSGSALVYSTYLGGSGSDSGLGIAVDAAGNAYVTGRTASSDFPTTQGAFQKAFGGVQDAFVAKVNPSGSALVYSTYLGGSGDEIGFAIAVDAAGNSYVTGRTGSANFPTTQGAFQPAFGGGISLPAVGIPPLDAFVAKLNAAGSALIYSTYIGGSGNETGESIAVDAAGNAYVTGVTTSSDFPTTPGAFQTVFGGGVGVFTGLPLDAWVAKLNPTGSALIYSTYLGGSGDEFGNGIAVDATGNAYVAGETTSLNFPTTNAPQPTFRGGFENGIVVKLNPSGSKLVYSTYLGGSQSTGGSEFAQAIAVDAAGNAYVTGATSSSDFPIVNPLQPTFGGSVDAFVARFGPSVVPFAAFSPRVEVDLGARTFAAKAMFTLGAGSNGIAPSTEDVSFQVGTFSTMIPAGSFRSDNGGFVFGGMINGVFLQARITPLSGNAFEFQAEGMGANLTGTVNPVPVGLTIGNDDGSIAVTVEVR